MNKRLIVAMSVLAAGVTAAGVLIGGRFDVETPLRAGDVRSCASIHFGMDDSTLGGYICTSGSTLDKGVEKKTLLDGLVSGITVNSFMIASDSTANGQLLVSGASYKISGKSYTATHTHGLKLGSGSGGSKLSITFASNVVACDVYVIGWNEASNNISVNDEEAVSVAAADGVSGTISPDTKSVTYTAVHFDFESTKNLTIVTAKRLFIGDIALRLA